MTTSIRDTGVSAQWMFPVEALQHTPSVETSNYAIGKELYDRARGVEFLFRLGSSLGLPSSAMFTAATWFHRFFMRFSMEDYHRQDIAAACIFLATKTEECGRKLRDVARVFQSKITGVDVAHIPNESLASIFAEVENQQTAILLAEEILLEALCFDFVTTSPHFILVELFDAGQTTSKVQDYAWSIAHDSYRTPLCILFYPRIIAAACIILAQRAADGPHSPSLDARISLSPPSASLPTPPSHKPASPDVSRFAVEYFGFNETDLRHVTDALTILLDFYAAQDLPSNPYISLLASIQPPTHGRQLKLYEPFARLLPPVPLVMNNGQTPEPSQNATPAPLTPSYTSSTAKLAPGSPGSHPKIPSQRDLS
ncbi:cyclin-like protein [Pisolithus croceorrhizus]|nr:cyclin-like protein [Pisolithus croceorrhizus]